MPPNHKFAAIQSARIKSRALGLRQSDIAAAVGASQSQVSRVFAGETAKRSKLVDQICKYVETSHQGVIPDTVRKNDILIEALAATWNGTEIHAKALASVIRALGVLNPSEKSAAAPLSRKEFWK